MSLYARITEGKSEPQCESASGISWRPRKDMTTFVQSQKKLRKAAKGRAAMSLNNVLQVAAHRAKSTGKDAFVIQGNSFMSRVFMVFDDPAKGLRTVAAFKPTPVIRVTPKGEVYNGDVNPRKHEEIDQCLITINEEDLYELRDSCLDCVRKHLSQALVAMGEALQGYPEHRWVAIGHMGEASDESIQEYPSLATEIREHRVKYMDDPAYVVPIMKLIAKASALAEAVDADATESTDFPHKYSSPASGSNRTGIGTAPPEEDPENDGILKIVQDGPDPVTKKGKKKGEEAVDDLPEPEHQTRPDAAEGVDSDEDVLAERAPTKKELGSGNRPKDVTWKEWLSSGGQMKGGKSAKKPPKRKKLKTTPKGAYHDPYKQAKAQAKKRKGKSPQGKFDFSSLTKGMDTFDDWDDDDSLSKAKWPSYSSSYGAKKYAPPPPKLTPTEKKVRDLAQSIGPINRIAAGGLVFRSFSAPSVWDLEVVISKLHPRFGSKWFFPKGGLDLGEAIYKGAAREVEEEAGVKAKVASPLAFKHSASFGDRGKYDLPLVLSILKKKHPKEAKFIDEHEKDFEREFFKFKNKSHYFVMSYKSGKPFPGPDPHMETSKSAWVKLGDAIGRHHRMREAVKFLLPVITQKWKPTGAAAKRPKPKRVPMPAGPVKPKAALYTPSGKSGGKSYSYLNLF